MPKKTDTALSNFNKLLKWLNDDEETAAHKYGLIHGRLVYIFLHRKAFPAEDLADKTIDIVIQKIDELIETYEGDPALYFYKVANNVHKEFLRTPQTEELDFDFAMQEQTESGNPDVYYNYLDDCLNNLPPDQCELILEYFENERREKIDYHKELTEKMEISSQSLRVKIFRIKKKLRKCVEKRLKKNSV